MESADKKIHYVKITRTIFMSFYHGYIVYVRQPGVEEDQLDAAIADAIEAKYTGEIIMEDTDDKRDIEPPLGSKYTDFTLTLIPSKDVPQVYDAEGVELKVIRVPLKYYYDEDIFIDSFPDLDFTHEVTNQPAELTHWQVIINNQFVEID